MGYKKILMGSRKKIALVAHDNQKQDLFEWAKFNRDVLAQHDLYSTGTTRTILGEELDLEIVKLEGGPLGRPADWGKISEGEIDFAIFFWDSLEPQPHDPDAKALLRIAVVWSIPAACNRARVCRFPDYPKQPPGTVGESDEQHTKNSMAGKSSSAVARRASARRRHVGSLEQMSEPGPDGAAISDQSGGGNPVG